jgi:hypothetical protein
MNIFHNKSLEFYSISEINRADGYTAKNCILLPFIVMKFFYFLYYNIMTPLFTI